MFIRLVILTVLQSVFLETFHKSYSSPRRNLAEHMQCPYCYPYGTLQNIIKRLPPLALSPRPQNPKPSNHNPQPKTPRPPKSQTQKPKTPKNRLNLRDPGAAQRVSLRGSRGLRPARGVPRERAGDAECARLVSLGLLAKWVVVKIKVPFWVP